LYAKENWFDLITNKPIENSPGVWGLKNYQPICPEKRPTLRYVINRIRNSLGHGYAKIKVPKNIKKIEMFDKITFEFKDEKKMRGKKDSFQITIKMVDLNKFIKKFQSEIHNYVRNK
ncbi:hypothetical protein IID19_05440, partial [Patescibacteria group bacterium]|nr:hypothetical protein [Patescibacteria group bacterium]